MAFSDKSLLRRSMTLWIQAERSRLYLRVREVRLQENTVAAWKARLAKVDRETSEAASYSNMPITDCCRFGTEVQ